MSEEQMIYLLIAFVLGWLVSRHMGNTSSILNIKPITDKHPMNQACKNCIMRDNRVEM